jgi:hypothetical protein
MTEDWIIGSLTGVLIFTLAEDLAEDLAEVLRFATSGHYTSSLVTRRDADSLTATPVGFSQWTSTRPSWIFFIHHSGTYSTSRRSTGIPSLNTKFRAKPEGWMTGHEASSNRTKRTRISCGGGDHARRPRSDTNGDGGRDAGILPQHSFPNDLS